MPKLSRTARAPQRMDAAVVSHFVMEGLVDPRVYRSVGVDPSEGHAAATVNPHFRETKLWMGEKIKRLLDEAGVDRRSIAEAVAQGEPDPLTSARTAVG